MDRQRAILVFAGALILALLVTFLLFRATSAPKAQATTSLVAAARDIPAGTKLQKGDIKTVRVLTADAPKAGITDSKNVLDRALLIPVSANEPLTPAKLAAPGADGVASLIEDGKRAIAVPINDASGVAGLIQPRAHVDVLFTRTGSLAEAASTIILENVTVLAIGRTTDTPQATTAAAVAARPSSTSATLLLSPDDSQKLELAKNQGKISLALRNPLDKSARKEDTVTTAEDLLGRFAPRNKSEREPAQISDAERAAIEKAAADKAVAQAATAVRIAMEQAEKERLAKEKQQQQPPKPKSVDVFRGDKHTQETFKQ